MKIKDILIFWKIWNFFVTCISLKKVFYALKKKKTGFVGKITGFRFFKIVKKPGLNRSVKTDSTTLIWSSSFPKGILKERWRYLRLWGYRQPNWINLENNIWT